jgi:hypothetical protein
MHGANSFAGTPEPPAPLTPLKETSPMAAYPNLKTDTWLRIICSMLVNAVLFGAGAIAILTIPALAEQARYLFPAVIVASFVLSPFIAGWIAPRMRLRYWGRSRGDAISG